MPNLKALVCALLTLLSASVNVSAYETRDIMVKLGAITIDHQSETGVDGLIFEGDTQAALSLTLMLNQRIGLEYISSTAYTYQVKQDDEKIGSVRSFSPTVSLQYYIMEPYYYIQPYVGLGFNHSFFFTEDGNVRNVGKSTGFAFSAGINTELSDVIFTNLSFYKLLSDPSYKTDDNQSEELELHSLLLFAGIGFKF